MQANLGLIKQNDEFVRDNKALSDHIDQMNIQMKGLEQKL